MPVTETTAMIAGMTPTLQPGRWIYCTTTEAQPVPADAFAMMREAEGTTLILPADTAAAHGFATDLAMRRVTLNVYSDLEGVGLTAAVAAALTEAGISCNVVAAYHHDHVFVPEADAARAMEALVATQEAAQNGAVAP
ncbi:MAG: ACT domain-containing protein [Pseudomonadota bacterium]